MERTDDELLAATRRDPAAFGVFYAAVGDGQICTFLVRAQGGGSGGCLPPDFFEDFAEGRSGVGTTGSGDGVLIDAMVPDGTKDARLLYRDGTTERVPIENNMVVVVAHKPPKSVSWTTPDGERFTSTTHGALGHFDRPGCPVSVLPLAPGAIEAAGRAALAQRPGAQAVLAAHRQRTNGSGCDFKIERRTVVVKLRVQGASRIRTEVVYVSRYADGYRVTGVQAS